MRRHGLVEKAVRETGAQGTVEYAIVFAAVLAIVAGCAAVWRAGAEGVFTSIARDAISHALSGSGFVDIALY